MKFSIVIPARNEGRLIGRCLDSIEAASRPYPGETEVIVVLNRCTDATERIARERGAIIARDDSRCLSRIRNAGARVARGEILITVDADSRMAPDMLQRIDRALRSGKFIGGGVLILPERWSLGIVLSASILVLMLVVSGMPGVSAGLFWCRREDFWAIGGFNEQQFVGEDVDFANRLGAYGKRFRKRFGTLRRSYIVTSCRKFDAFGDWYFFFRPWLIWQVIHGVDSGFSGMMWYDFRR